MTSLSGSILLNYKKVPYQIRWINFPEVEATYKSVGAAPTGKKKDGSPRYTLPFIVVTPTGSGEPYAISDSLNIAEFIEKTFPDPANPLFPEGTRIDRATFNQFVFEKISTPMFPLIMQDFLSLLSTHDAEWYEKTREGILGFPVQNMYPKDEVALRACQEKLWAGFDALAELLDVDGPGNFRLAKGSVVYAEIELVARLFFMRRNSPEKIWAHLKGRNNGRWEKLLAAYSAWLPA